MIRPSRLASLLAALTATAGAQPSPAPDSAAARVDRVFAAWRGTDSPGCAVGVSQGGRVVLERGYGMANLETDTPIRPGTIFHTASVSKQFTAMAIMLLARDGRLSLDDDVRKHIPELPDYGTRITIRHMLLHTSGLRDQWSLLATARGRFEEERITEADVMDIVTRQRSLNFTPGAEYVYSNTGYTLAGVIVKRVSGKSLRDFAQERIFTPLGMTQTHFHDDYTRVVRGRASAYAPRPGGTWRVSIPNYDTYGATSLFSTVGDLLKWEANFERPVVGDSALLAEMQRSGVLTNGDSTNYGLGLQTGRHRGELQVGHGGADAGYRAYVWRFPSKGLAGAVLCNFASADAGAFFQQVSDAYLGAPATAEAPNAAPPAGIALGAAELERRAGVYHNPATEAVVFLRVANGRLQTGRTGGMSLVPLDAHRFRNPAGTVEYTFSTDGRTLAVRPTGLSVQPQTFVRHEPARAVPRALAAYGGSYASAELGGATYRVTATDSTLELRTRTSEPVVMRPAFGDTFETGGRVARFTRDSRGRVTGFTLSDGRMRRVAFRRA